MKTAQEISYEEKLLERPKESSSSQQISHLTQHLLYNPANPFSLKLLSQSQEFAI